MEEKLPVYPFDTDRVIGTVTEVNGTNVKLNLPQAAAPGSRWHYGARLEAGRVGEFVVIEASDVAVFGRIISVRLPEKERLSVEEELGREKSANPIGFVQLMATASLRTGRIDAGVPTHPRLGAKCYAAHPLLIQWLAQHTKGIDRDTAKLINLAVLPFSKETQISLAPESLFGRHCAVLGATGGGKSWTIARLIEETCKFNAKILLVDATGEYTTLQGEHIVHTAIRSSRVSQAHIHEQQVDFPYKYLKEGDLFALFRASSQSQAPKLRAAIKSLKLVANRADLGPDGLYRKANTDRRIYDKAMLENAALVESQEALFYIEKLKDQVIEECVGINYKNADFFGDTSQQELGFCSSLIQRVEQIVSAPELSCVFRPNKDHNFINRVFEPFMANPTETLLRLSLRDLSFEFGIREVLVNAIGRYLLTRAREGAFEKRPLIVIVDEAHQFLGKAIGDEYSAHRLDAFELIAKEGRKYCLNLCLATQRPRDLGQGVLSQMGTFLVHRLTNPEDRDLVERAAGDLDRSAASFIPTLAAGQAVLIGIDFPIPVTLQILPPRDKPASSGPKYQEFWAGTFEK